jgi:hypothetical protein
LLANRTSSVGSIHSFPGGVRVLSWEPLSLTAEILSPMPECILIASGPGRHLMTCHHLQETK